MASLKATGRQKFDVNEDAFKLQGTNEARDMARGGFEGSGAFQAPTAAVDMTGFGANQAAVRGQQGDFLQALQSQAQPGVLDPSTQAMVQQNADNAFRQALAVSQAGQNVSPVLAAQNANQALVNAQAQGTNIALQGQGAAQDRFLAALQGVRGQDQSFDLNSLDLQQRMALANQDAGLQAQALRQQGQLGFFDALQGVNLADQQARAQAEAARMEAFSDFAARNAKLFIGQQDQEAQMVGAGVGAAATLGAKALFSDETLKTDIDRDVGEDVDEFLRALDTAGYRYKNEKHGEGEHYSAMAQSVARSRVGRTFVTETDEGLALDTRRGFGAVLASLKRLDERTAKLERGAA